jgi:hypothetical protein
VLTKFPAKPAPSAGALDLRPTVTVQRAAELIDVSAPSASVLVSDLVKPGVPVETTGRQRDRVFRYRDYDEALGGSSLPFSARTSRQDAEEGLDVGVGADVAVAVEVGAAAGGAACAGKAGEEGLDVGVGADVAVAVEVGGVDGQ